MANLNSLKLFFVSRVLILLILIFVSFFSLRTINLIGESISEKIEEEINLEKIEQTVIELAEDNARNQTRGIAKQMQIYINDHSEMTLEDLKNDPVFQNIAVQEYGKKSYSAVLSSDCVTVFHISPSIIGMSSKDFKEKLGLPTDEIWEIHKQACEQGIESEGYYTWRHEKGHLPEKKFIRMAYGGTTADGKKLYLGATSYVTDFLAPVRQLEAENMARRTAFLNETVGAAEKASNQIIITITVGLIILILISLKEKSLFGK